MICQQNQRTGDVFSRKHWRGVTVLMLRQSGMAFRGPLITTPTVDVIGDANDQARANQFVLMFTSQASRDASRARANVAWKP